MSYEKLAIDEAQYARDINAKSQSWQEPVAVSDRASPIYVSTTRCSPVMKVAPPLCLAVIGFIMYRNWDMESLRIFYIAEMTFLIAMFGIMYLRFPRRFEIWADRLCLVSKLSTTTILYSDILSVRHLSSLWCYARCFMTNYATSMRNGVEIITSSRCKSFMISPRDAPEFIGHLSAALVAAGHPAVVPSV
eukprot:TRINITY_DN7025_c0_g2_i1.p2 TRINITY_DN7025_c0_g2~~TRINITY_DN7025_c0_g2_i1.p2  ORF type:complete len:191 (-),score=19.12 TRINITY_DN7025_c0_g2_i1:1052-1624(-)